MVQSEGSPLESLSELSLASSPSSPWPRDLKSEERGLWLIQLLLACAAHVTAGNVEHTNACLEQISALASLTGDPMQRVATYFMEALAARITKRWPGLYRALGAARLPAGDAAWARRAFFDLCPLAKFVNRAIVDATDGEQVVHVIDLDASDPAQWVALLRGLRARPGGPPHLKITGIHERRDVLDRTSHRLTEEAEALHVPFQFNAVAARLEDVDAAALHVKTGDAVAVSAVLRLHALLAEDDERPRVRTSESSDSPAGNGADRTLAELLERERTDRNRNGRLPPPINNNNNNNNNTSNGNGRIRSCGKVDRVLRTLRGVSPKVMVAVEQESNHNGGTLMERFVEALHFYSAVFDSLESSLPRHCPERVSLEKHLFGQQINNIVACEGAERVERHEKLERWMRRLDGAGFALLPLAYTAAPHGDRIPNSSYSSEAYRIVEDRGCLILCWQDRPLFSVSAWQS